MPTIDQMTLWTAVDCLKADGIVLLLTDKCWSLACDARSRDAVERLINGRPFTSDDQPEALVSSLDMLKRHVPHIHPRIETLLHYHNRPTTVCYPDVQNIASELLKDISKFPIRIVFDQPALDVITSLDQAIITLPASGESQRIPLDFRSVPDKIKRAADYILLTAEYETERESPVVISYDADGVIHFHEE